MNRKIDWNDIINKNSVMPGSYIIYIDDKGYTCAMNGKCGCIKFKGIDTTEVMNNVTNSLNNGNIFVKGGTYIIDSNVNIGNNIIGEGDITKFILGASGHMLVNNQNNIKISNILIDGSNQTSANDPPFGNNGSLSVIGSNNVIVDNVIIKDAYRFGIYIHAGTSTDMVMIQNCLLNGLGNNDVIGGDSANSNNGLTNIIIKNNVITQDAGIGEKYGTAIDITGVYRVEFINNLTYGNIVFGGEVYPNKYSIISGNILKNPPGKSSVAVAIYSTSGSTIKGTQLSITDNIIENGHIDVIGTSTAYILNGLISNNLIDATNYTWAAIDLERASLFNIEGNVIKNGAKGILLDHTTYTNIIGNIITGSTTGIEANAPSYIMISNNIFNSVATKITGTDSTSKIFNNMGYATESDVLSGTFTIDSTGIKIVTIPHGLDITPAVQNCHLSVVQNTAVDDWAYNMLKIVSTDATSVICKINVSITSITIGATAKLALRVGNI